MNALDFNSVGKESRVEDKPRTLSLEPDLLVASKQCLVSVMGIQTNPKGQQKDNCHTKSADNNVRAFTIKYSSNSSSVRSYYEISKSLQNANK